MGSAWIQILIILLLILANGFFASSEIALISARRSRIKQLSEKGHKKAQLVNKLQNKPDVFLATVQVGITLVGTLASVMGGAKLVDHLKPWIEKIPSPVIQNSSESIAIGMVVVIITYFLLVLGELVPKYLALAHPEKVAFRTVGPVHALSNLAFIVVKLLSNSSRFLVSLFVKEVPKESGFVTDEELKFIVHEGKTKGIFDQTEEELIRSALEFTDTTVRNAMTPRTEIIALDKGTGQQQVIRAMTEEGFSRIPVYKDNLDNIVGIIYAKDIINLLQNRELIILEDILRRPYFVPDSMKISELLKNFQKKQLHMAIVLDEFGGTAGLITLEDIIEEIVGEIRDEYDQEEEEIYLLSDNLAIVNASLFIGEFNQKFGTDLPEEYNTVGGYLTGSLGRIPLLDEEIKIGNLTFVIFDKVGPRLKKIKVIRERKE
ncbi:MAG: HlyC/CorC family transporter [candidate division Zixibacteria bacterium]|nr:HlyC/CorC family transporter [candidate division Zixibacteria bacterium]